MRVLIFDIESAPMLAYVWGARADWISAESFTHETFLISWAAKWEDGKRVFSDVLTSEEAREQDDARIVQSLADMLREADVVVAHNGNAFDIPMVNNRLLQLGLEPLGPIRTIDTLKLARKSFRLAHNKLDYLAKQLGLGGKLSTSFALWRDCYHGDEKALRRMVRYNRQDVVVLQSVYERLKPYVKGLPRLVDAREYGERVCPHCGSDSLQKRGFYRTNSSTFQQFQCQNPQCKRNCRARVAEKDKSLGVVPIAS